MSQNYDTRVTTRVYVNAIVEDGELRPVGNETANLQVVKKRIQRKPMYRHWSGDGLPVVIAYRDLPPWRQI